MFNLPVELIYAIFDNLSGFDLMQLRACSLRVQHAVADYINDSKKYPSVDFASYALLFNLQLKLKNSTPLRSYMNDIAFVDRRWLDNACAIFTQNAWRYAVAQRCSLLKNVPLALRDQELCMRAVRVSGRCIVDTPRYLRSRELCELALTTYAFSILWIPKRILTQEMCNAAFDKAVYVIEFIPMHFITDDMCACAIENRLNDSYLSQQVEKIRARKRSLSS